jgi:hypothetical protein
MPRRAVPASPGGECCRPGSASRALIEHVFGAAERAAPRIIGVLALAPKTAGGCADRVGEPGSCNRWP